MQQQPNSSNPSNSNTSDMPAVLEDASAHAQQRIAEATARADAHAAWARANRIPRLRNYLAFRTIALDAEEIIRHFEQVGDDAVIDHSDPFALEADFTALLDRFEERLRDEFLPTNYGQRQAQHLVAHALRELLAHVEMGHIQGGNMSAGHGQDSSDGILEILAGDEDLFGWKSLRDDEAAPLLIERWLWHVEPGETPETCSALALIWEWILRALS